MRLLILFILTVSVIAGVWLGFRYLERESRIDMVIQTLKSIPRTQLVVQTDETLARIRIDDDSPWYGRRSACASITVRLHWAVNLAKLTTADIRIAGHTAVVMLPPLECLDVVPDLAAWEFHGRKSGLFYIADALRGRTLRDDAFRATAQSLASMRYRDGSQYRPDVIQRLNMQSAAIFAGTGLTVSFK